MTDAENHRIESSEFWERAAFGWTRRQGHMREFTAAVSHWLVDAVDPQPGHRLLELACGLAETGLLAAELVVPGGSVVCSDQAQAMLDGAGARAQELGIKNVEFQLINAEWIDFPVASFDGVICRWGYMLMADPAASLRETRRVLRSGGRLALAVWDAVEHNPWAQVPGGVLRRRGLLAPSTPGAPGPFALGDGGRVEALLADCGFEEIEVEVMELAEHHADFDSYWDTRVDLSGVFADAIERIDATELAATRDEVHEALAPYRRADGALSIPGRTLVASASA